MCRRLLRKRQQEICLSICKIRKQHIFSPFCPIYLSGRLVWGKAVLEEKQRKAVHKIQITDRSTGTVTGVKDVNSFDEKEISLVTEEGVLMIKGEELHVTRLDLEKQEIDLAGRVDSLAYSQGIAKAKGGEGMLKRLLG